MPEIPDIPDTPGIPTIPCMPNTSDALDTSSANNKRQINPAHLVALMAMINESPYFQLLSMRLCSMGVGFATVEVDLQRKHMNAFGLVHGGTYSSILDSAAYWSVYCELGDDVGHTTLDISANNLAMASKGLITVEGRSIKVGRSICLATATARDTNGRLLAHGSSKLMVLQARQTIDQAVRAMGYKPLPPKFL
ncbi:MAG: PaaI family thioesterase [Coriobacteriia bacterium]|nr:PaaI family thioesterase [Coriobacteriia bacterium]